jgi:DNA-binding transcriptional ArsR family regulator
VTEIASRFTVSQPAISQQLGVLLKASLVTADTVGRQHIYRINPAGLRPVHNWVLRTIADPAGHVWSFKPKPQTKKGN